MFFQQKRGKKTSLFLLTGLGFIFNRTGENLEPTATTRRARCATLRAVLISNT